MAEILIAKRDRAQYTPPIALPALPPGYSHMTPHQQAEAELERRRTAKQAEDAAIAAAAVPQPGDDDITEAEIID
jgi:hypothetical protein